MSNYLLIDVSYACFYRFYANKTWFKFSHPEETIEPNTDWTKNIQFMEKYEKIFDASILNLMDLYNISKENVILAKDCSRKNIWRNKVYSEYKSTREASHIKSGFDGREVFKYTHDVLIPKWGYKCYSHPELEADDIIANLVKQYSGNSIYILASDHDYLQLVDNNVTLIDMKGKIKTCENAHHELWKKILMGDKSDNIPCCLINQKAIYPERNERYIKCSNKVMSILFNDWETWYSKIVNDNIIKDNSHLLNQNLIDFKYIPENLTSNIAEINFYL